MREKSLFYLAIKRKKSCRISTAQIICINYALSTLLDLKQEVQTYKDLCVPLTLHLTFLMLAFHILFDLL